MLVTARQEDHETRSGNREHQVEGGEYCTTKQSARFTAGLIHINKVVATADGSIWQMLICFKYLKQPLAFKIC